MSHSANNDAQALHKALKGLGTDDKVLVDVFIHRSRKHLQEVKAEFHNLYKKSLEDWIKGDTSGNFEKILLALLERRTDLKVKYIHDATAGLGTNEEVLIQILGPASNKDIQKIAEHYRTHHKVELPNLIRSEVSGQFARVFAQHLKAERPSENEEVDEDLAAADAKRLYDAGEGKWGTDEAVFVDILTKRSRKHIHRVGKHYEQKAGHTLEKGLAKELSGDLLHLLLTFVQTPAEYHAELFHKAVAGAGTNDSLLIRLLSTLSKKQLKEANVVYTSRHSNTLATAIKGETSGSYEAVLLGLLPPVV